MPDAVVLAAEIRVLTMSQRIRAGRWVGRVVAMHLCTTAREAPMVEPWLSQG